MGPGFYSHSSNDDAGCFGFLVILLIALVIFVLGLYLLPELIQIVTNI